MEILGFFSTKNIEDNAAFGNGWYFGDDVQHKFFQVAFGINKNSNPFLNQLCMEKNEIESIFLVYVWIPTRLQKYRSLLPCCHRSPLIENYTYQDNFTYMLLLPLMRSIQLKNVTHRSNSLLSVSKTFMNSLLYMGIQIWIKSAYCIQIILWDQLVWTKHLILRSDYSFGVASQRKV